MKIKDNTKGILQEVDKLILESLEEVTPKIEATAKQIVTVVTGALKESITTEISGNSSGTAAKAVIGSPLEYAPEVEMDKPFLRPALHGNMKAIRKAFRK